MKRIAHALWVNTSIVCLCVGLAEVGFGLLGEHVIAPLWASVPVAIVGGISYAFAPSLSFFDGVEK